MSNVDSMVREAIKAYKAGQKAEARALLEKATEMDAHNEKAWMWLSAVVETPEDQRVCLENVIFLNPDNEDAKRGLAILDEQLGTSSTASTSTASSSVEEASYDDDLTSSLFDDDDSSGDVYDSWASDIGSSGSGSSPFTMDVDEAFEDVFGSAFEDDLYGDSAQAEEEPDSAFASSTDSLYAADDLFGSDTFGSDDDLYADDLREESFSSGSLYGDDDEDDPFADGPFALPDSGAAFAEAPAAPRKSSPAASRSRPSGGSSEADNVEIYFQSLDKGIKATRLPGGGGVPVGSLLLMLVLIAANVGAVLMLSMS